MIRALALAVVTLSSGCFLLVSSGIRREIPEGARAASSGLLRPHERVVAAWDGSMMQDGSLLVVLSDVSVIKHDGDVTARVDLIDVKSIVVNEDDGSVDVVTAGGLGVSLPLRSSDERKGFAKLVQTEVQRAKRDAHHRVDVIDPPPTPPTDPATPTDPASPTDPATPTDPASDP